MAQPASLLSARQLSKAFGPEVILDGVDLSIHAGERVGMVGANGCGKSTLARILAKLIEPDSGEVVQIRDARVAYLSQTPQLDPASTPRREVLTGLTAWTEARARYDQISSALDQDHGNRQQLLDEQAAAAADLERLGGWDQDHLADEMLGYLGLAKPDARLGTMSGGEQRRVALARILVAGPELAILDEPTNHLDLLTIEWLEQYLLESFKGALLLITHDRYFIDRVVQRTLELSHGKLYSYQGGYEAYLEAKAERLEHQARAEANRQNFLRQELQWLRRQPKARTTRQKARVQRAQAALVAEGPERQRQVHLRVSSERSGKSILELQGLYVTVAGRELVRDLSFIMTRGQRVGIVGPNGCGKTSLLRTIIGELDPEQGQVVLGKNTKVSYLSQTRDDLDESASVQQNVAGRGLTVYLGKQELDVHSYLARFLFVGQALHQPVGALSGGERTRVALAKLLLEPANLILMDEPTNDLDIPTLSSLEQLLLEFEGNTMVVTHDRYFLDRVATDILAFEADGRVTHYSGSYTLYQQLRPRPGDEPVTEIDNTPKKQKQRPRKRRTLTYAEALELKAIEPQVEAADARVAELEARLGDPAVYRSGGSGVPDLLAELEEAKSEAARLMARWEELESKRLGE